MMALRFLWTDPTLRLAAILLFLVGAIASTFAPHVAVLAVQRFGLGDFGLAILMVVSMVVSVVASIAIGIRTDQTTDRRQVAIIAAALWLAGHVLMTVHPTAFGFVLTQALLFPFGASLFGQLFALARLAASTYPPEDRDTIMSAVRAVFAAPFVVVLPVWSLAFQAGTDVMAIYPAGLMFAAAILGLTWRFWPRAGQTGWTDVKSGLSIRSALAELVNRSIGTRVLALGAVMAGGTTYITAIGLLFDQTAGRGPADASLYIGLVAGLEVPFMLFMVPMLRAMSRTVLILIGAVLYAMHLALLPVLADSAVVWVLVLPAAIGGALTLTLPIAYMQNMMADRPGAGSSLITLQHLGAHVIAAACFAFGTWVWGYGNVTVLGAAVSVSGAGWLHWADRRRAMASGVS